MRTKGGDYSVLNSQLLNLEHRFDIIKQEKDRLDRDIALREELEYKKKENLNAELNSLERTLVTKEQEIRQANLDLKTYQELLEAKNFETSKLKKEIASLQSESIELYSHKKNVESDLVETEKTRKAAESEKESMLFMNDRLYKSRLDIEGSIKESELQIAVLTKKLQEAEIELNDLQKKIVSRENEIEFAKSGIKLSQNEADELAYQNSKLKDENVRSSLKISDFEKEIFKFKRQIDDASVLITSKDKDYKSLISGTTYANGQDIEARAEIRRLQQENDTLSRLLERYKGDVESQRKLRNQEVLQKIEIEEQKKKVERTALQKSIEASIAKRELDKIQDSHERLIEDKEQLSQELSAVKEHAEVLESQNVNVKFLL